MQIRVLSEGGLGNQLFQASYAHRTAMVYPNHYVYFVNDNSKYDRKFELDDFFEECPHVKQSESNLINGMNRHNLHLSLSRRVKWYKGANYLDNLYKEEGGLVGFDSDFDLHSRILASRSKNLNVRGYFQKSKYNFPVDPCFAKALFRALEKNARRLLCDEFTCVHVRRGDFLHFSSHGPLSKGYFTDLLYNLERYAGGVIIHSDDPTIVDKFASLPIKLSEFSLSSNVWDVLSDASRSACFIGSNSSLSWWAAYCAQNFGHSTKKNIYFPSEWFRGVSTKSLEIIPESWKTVKVQWD